jgi:hypothetical protein
MIKKVFYNWVFSMVFLLLYNPLIAQQSPKQADTFFLAKKKGLLGRLGKSMSTTPADETPVKVENPFLKYKGKIIRSIQTIRLGFEYDINDTSHVKKGIGVAVGKKFHKNTSSNVIRNNLFFREGDPVYPYLLADNERYLRDLVYLKDAKILVDYAKGSNDSVDVTVLTKDVFSIGGKLQISSTSQARGRAELREENFMGSGTRLLLSGYHEKGRFPQTAIGGELIRRNIAGTFIDWTSGYQDYRTAFSSGRNQETVVYTRFEKPLVTAYIPSTGSLEWSYQRTRNVYDGDSLYRYDIKYAYYNLDGWFGYSLDSKRSLYAHKEIRIHRFIAIRGFKQHFLSLPTKYQKVYDYRFTDFTGALASINIFKQVFYKTNFIYGFGRSEDIPEGFSTAVTAGYVKKQNVRRPYSGLDASLARYNKQGFYSNFTIRLGGYFYQKRFEDVDLLFSVDHFTRLRKISSGWYSRLFISSGITAQVNPSLNAPLYLTSEFGLPYFNNGSVSSDLRTTVKAESVFYNTTKILGFRFAPFAFTDLSMVKPSKMGLEKSDLYTAVGGGIRTRNENLVYGTIELKAYYFPRLNGDMKSWKLELNSNIRFRYRSSFISRPDFITAN